MSDLQTRFTQALREKARAEDGRPSDLLTCPFGCEGLVFNQPDSRWHHLQAAHPGDVSDSLEGLGPFEPRAGFKSRAPVRSSDSRKNASIEAGGRSPGPRPPSAESMNVEPISRSQTPTRPTTDTLAQLSIKQRQTTVSPNSPLRDAKLSPATSSSSRKRAASDIQPAAATPRHPPQNQSFQAQRRDVSSGDVKLAVPGSPNIDPEFSRDIPFSLGPEMQNPPTKSNRHLYDPSSGKRSTHARNTSAPTKSSGSGRHHQLHQPERPIIHEKQGIGTLSVDSSPTDHGQRALAREQAVQSSVQESLRSKSLPHHPRGVFQIPAQAKYPDLIMQPDSRPISHDQLAAEVKGIYAGLVMVEGKCISVDSMQMSSGQQFTPDHWQALVALHRTLLHEHHDFLLASQHPSANSALRRLAAKYSMPGRMWKHGIHSFLELMRRYLPDSREYMIAFILLAYQMMALLFETVPAFEQTWIECLGDLGRYRMAVEDDDFRDRETWGAVARSWYSKAADQSPEVGRLYHHLAILAGPNALQKLFYYIKASTCVQPFQSARESILTLFDPLLGPNPPAFARSHPGDANFIRLHAALFGRSSMESFKELATEYIRHLDAHIGRVTAKWNEAGVYIAVANIAGVLEYGATETELMQAYQEVTQAEGLSSELEDKTEKSPSQEEASAGMQQDTENLVYNKAASAEQKVSYQTVQQACGLALDILKVALNRIGDKNILPHVHVFLVFILGLFALPQRVTQYVLERFPWDQLAFFLNTLASSEDVDSRVQALSDFLSHDHRPLPEDFLIRGQIWCLGFFPTGWFNDGGDVEERMLERASTSKARAERILWIGTRIGSFGRWLQFDSTKKHFSVIKRTQHDSPEEDSEEMAFVKQSLDLGSNEPSKGFTHGMLMCIPQVGLPPIAQLVVRDFTVLVLDTSMLLNQLPFFTSTSQGGAFDIVIPDEVIVRLKFLDGVFAADDSRARDALKAVKTSINEGRRVMIKNAKGVDVTSEAFVSSRTERHDAQASDLEEITIGLARRETDRDLEQSRAPSDKARPAILVTEDRKMRVKANSLKVAAIASSFLSKVILGARTRSKSRERGIS